MTTTKGTAADMAAIATMAGETMVEWLRELEGFQGLLMLSNDETGTTHVISFWESEDAFNAFGAERLGPAMAQLGIEVQPEVTFHAAHEVFIPQPVVLT